MVGLVVVSCVRFKRIAEKKEEESLGFLIMITSKIHTIWNKKITIKKINRKRLTYPYS